MEDSDEKTHAIIVNDLLKPNKPLIITLMLKSVTSSFPSRRTRTSEYEDELISHIDMTNEALLLEHYEVSFEVQSDAMTGFRGEVIRNETITRGLRVINLLSTGEEDAVDFTDDENFLYVINAKVNMARIGVSKGKHGVTSESLSHKRLIPREASNRIVQHTTQ